MARRDEVSKVERSVRGKTDGERAGRAVGPARAGRAPGGLGATLAALAVVFLLFYAFVLRPAPSATAPALDTAWGRFSLTVERFAGGSPAQGSVAGTFLVASDGSVRVEATVANDGARLGRPGDNMWVYDAATDTAIHSWTDARGTVEALVTVESRRPWRSGGHTPVDYQGLAAIVRSAVEDGDAAIGIKPVVHEGRSGWRASWKDDGLLTDVIVDRESGLVVWCSRFFEGAGGVRERHEYAATGLTLDTSPPAGSFSVRPPPGARLETVRDERRYVDGVGGASETLGLALAESTLLPDGFRPMLWSILEERDPWPAWIEGWASGPAVGPTRAQKGVQIVYTRGLAAFEVEIVPAAGLTTLGDFDWSGLLSHKAVTLQYGSFRGRSAHTFFDDAPSAIAWNDDFAVRVRGCITRLETVAVLEGLTLPQR
jgi:hypothetical protein